jgi:hypothetical protein
MIQGKKYWKFKDFVLQPGATLGVVESWIDGLPVKKDQAKIEAFIRRLEVIKNWPTNLVFPLTGYKKIYELKIKGRIQYRPLGCYGPKPGEFTLLMGAEEKNHKFEPKSAPDMAVERQRLIQDQRFTKYLWTSAKES